MSVHRASVVLKPAARRDVRSILLYTERHWGATQRAAYQDDIDRAMATLSLNPRIGRSRNDIAVGVHSFGVQQHIIFYRVDPGTVTVLRILHRSMQAAIHVDGIWFSVGLAMKSLDSYYELFDLESGNVIEDYERESDAIETFALTHVKNGKPILIAMQHELVLRVEREMERLAPQRRSS